jgi:hypothetical protein
MRGGNAQDQSTVALHELVPGDLLASAGARHQLAGPHHHHHHTTTTTTAWPLASCAWLLTGDEGQALLPTPWAAASMVLLPGSGIAARRSGLRPTKRRCSQRAHADDGSGP